MDVDRDASAVVGDGHRAIVPNHDVNAVAVAGQRLVDRVVDDFVDQVMQSAEADIADVHRRTLPHRLETFQYLDIGGSVSTRHSLGFHTHVILLKPKRLLIRFINARVWRTSGHSSLLSAER